MSTPSGSVLARATLKRESLELIKQMIWASVNEALNRAVARIEALQASGVSQVPIDTGRLRRSFKIAMSPGQIIMHWSAIDPRSGFDYASVQDVGRANMVGKYYSDVMKDQSKQIVHEELLAALRRNLP